MYAFLFCLFLLVCFFFFQEKVCTDVIQRMLEVQFWEELNYCSLAPEFCEKMPLWWLRKMETFKYTFNFFLFIVQIILKYVIMVH